MSFINSGSSTLEWQVYCRRKIFRALVEGSHIAAGTRGHTRRGISSLGMSRLWQLSIPQPLSSAVEDTGLNQLTINYVRVGVTCRTDGLLCLVCPDYVCVDVKIEDRTFLLEAVKL